MIRMMMMMWWCWWWWQRSNDIYVLQPHSYTLLTITSTPTQYLLHITYAHCVITLLSHLLWIYHVCAFVCTHTCVHMFCIYTFHLHTPRTYILSCIYAHKILRIYKHLSTIVYLFDCLIIFVCVPCTISICIRLCLRLRSYFATAIVPELNFIVYIYIQRSIENDDAKDSSYDMIRSHRCDLSIF